MARITGSRGFCCALAVALLVPVASHGEESAAAPDARPRVKAAKATARKAAADADAPAKAKAKSRSRTSGKLTPKQITFVRNELAPVAASGNPLQVLELIGPQLAKLSPAHVEGMNELLAEQGLPSLGRLAADARLDLSRGGMAKSAPELSLQESVLILAAVKQQIDELLEKIRKAEVMQDPLPKPDSLLAYRDVLFDVHVQKNELTNADELVKFASATLKSLDSDKTRTATKEQQEVLATNFGDTAAAVTTLGRDMEERALEMRLDRLDLAVSTLERDLGLKEKFFAAYAIAIDGELLLEGFKAGGSFSREALNKPDLVEELTQKIEKGKQLAGTLIDKSKSLFIGLHWWRRGRYGRGPEGYGLLKSAASTRSFAASVPLFMPRTAPVPTNPIRGRQPADPQQASQKKQPSGQQQSPDFDRRHHYTWAWQDRQFKLGLSSQSSTSTDVLSHVNNADEQFY